MVKQYKQNNKWNVVVVTELAQGKQIVIHLTVLLECIFNHNIK